MNYNKGKKGFEAEEALRCYFNNVGYFSVRGLPLTYMNIDVTDIDLWLYAKASSLSAERVCVDIKRGRPPRAMERILWVKGLKNVIGVDKAMVATMDNRPEIRAFGTTQNIGVLQGGFLKRVVDSFPPKDRLTEEDLYLLLNTPCVVDSSIRWGIFLKDAKAKLIGSLNFNGCNSLLTASEVLFHEYLATGGSEVATRLLYIIVAYLLIAIDFISRVYVPLETNKRELLLTDGFRYGEIGHQKTEEAIQLSIELLNESGRIGICSKDSLEEEFNKQLSDYSAEVLGEFFSKPEILKNLFNCARALEYSGYAKDLQKPTDVPSVQKAVIGMLCDFFGHDRKKII